MQSRVRTVVSPEKRQPSAFKAMCLPNTDFMVDFLGFFTRDDFEKYLQLSCKRMNQLILAHFHSKPYRYLEDVTLICHLNVNYMTMCLSKPPNKCNWTKPNHTNLKNRINLNIAFSKMLPFLNMSVRVPNVKIWLRHNTVLSQESIDQLKSISHIWENGQVEFTTGKYVKDNLVSRAALLNETKLFRCRRFKCSYSDNAMLPLWDYPEIFALESVEVYFSAIESMESFDIVQLIEKRALYPHSQTTFVFSGIRYRRTHHANIPHIMNDIFQNICHNLMQYAKAPYFQIIFAIGSDVFSKLPDHEMNKFRIENNSTREVVHIRRVTYNDVAKYCEFDAKTKYFILERYHVQ